MGISTSEELFTRFEPRIFFTRKKTIFRLLSVCLDCRFQMSLLVSRTKPVFDQKVCNQVADPIKTCQKCGREPGFNQALNKLAIMEFIPNKAIVDSRLCPVSTCCSLSLSEIWFEWSSNVGIHVANITSSAKPEVTNVSQRCHSEPSHSHNIITISWSLAILFLSGQTDRQTDRHAHHNMSHPTRGRSSEPCVARVHARRTATMVFLSMMNMPSTLTPTGSPFRRFRNTFI